MDVPWPQAAVEMAAQGTIIAVAQQMPEFRYELARGSVRTCCRDGRCKEVARALRVNVAQVHFTKPRHAADLLQRKWNTFEAAVGCHFSQHERPLLDGRVGRIDNAGVNVEHIRTRVQEKFRPFAVVTSSGNKYPVPHPDFILLTPRTVVIADQKGYAVVLDPLHIVGLEDLPARRNGGRRSRRR